MREVFTMWVLILVGLTPAAAESRDQQTSGSRVLWIGLANGTELESTMAGELRALVRKYDTEPWILTDRVLIDKDQIPHSHPVLTIHTRHIGNELALLSTFIHEQLHWLEAEPWLVDFQNAMTEFEELFPEVPSSAEGGARDRQSTYRHFLVCDMELQALTTLVGETRARETIARHRYYRWIYEKVLTDPRIREVSLKHGFNVAKGVPGR